MHFLAIKPATTAGDPSRPSPLIDNLILLLFDAESREKFKQEFTQLMDFFTNVEKYTNGTYRWFSMERYNVLAQNSAPNKPHIYGGVSLERLEAGENANWLWDVFEEQGFKTTHSDGDCGGFKRLDDPSDWDYGDATHFYMKEQHRHGRKRYMIGNHHFPAPALCDNNILFTETDPTDMNHFSTSCDFRAPTSNMTFMEGFSFMTGPYCIGHKTIAKHTLDFIEEFMDVYKGEKRFATATFLDTHVDSRIRTHLDNDTTAFIKKMIIGDEKTGAKPILSNNRFILFLFSYIYICF